MPKFEEYNEATQLQDNDLFVMKQGNETKKITGRNLCPPCYNDYEMSPTSISGGYLIP